MLRSILVLALLIVLLLPQASYAQTEVLTVQGNLPRYNYRDNNGNFLWSIPANSVLWKLDGPINSGVIVTTSAARSNTIVLNEGGLGVFNGFPAAPLHIGNVASQTFPGEIRFHPGDGTASATIHAVNGSQNTTMVLESQGVGRNVSMRLTNTTTSFQHAVSNNYAIRDVNNNVNPLVVFPSAANSNAIIIRNGRIGLGVTNPTAPLQLANGASCSTGGVWTNASSKDLKQDIEQVSTSEARETLRALNPVSYTYKADPAERHVGFIAEEVPESVATNSRRALSPMDFVGVLTKVVQDQDQQLQMQSDKLHQQELELKRQSELIAEQGRLLEKLSRRLDEISN